MGGVAPVEVAVDAVVTVVCTRKLALCYHELPCACRILCRFPYFVTVMSSCVLGTATAVVVIVALAPAILENISAHTALCPDAQHRFGKVWAMC